MQANGGPQANPRVVSSDGRWRVVNACALLLGVATSLLLARAGPNPIFKEAEGLRLAARFAHYLFHPLSYLVVAALFAFVVIRNQYVGLWSVFCSFMVGGLLVSFFLALAKAFPR